MGLRLKSSNAFSRKIGPTSKQEMVLRLYKELKRLNPKIKIKHTPITVRKKSVTGTPELVTLSLIKLMIS